jgi:polyhydroxyalkanoate synthesis regulator phasin
MVRDALRTYLSLASGLADVPRQQAVRAARALVSQGEATAEQAGSLAEDLLGTSRANRAALLQLIRYEVDRGLGRLGLATADEVSDLTARVHQLEAELRALRTTKTPADRKPAADKAGKKAAKVSPAKRAPTKKTAAKTTAAKTTAKTAAARGRRGEPR